tara:strand:+ start:361 stop:564 length:204 start_codon:yes stop_codon:yes gene_type:complete
MDEETLTKLLSYITTNVYDTGHGCLYGVVDSEGLMGCIAELVNLTPVELGKKFDQVRKQVHGEDVDA